MPILKNPKHELFAQAISRGESGRVSYREAGFICNDAAADSASSRLLKNVKVLARVEELKGRQVKAEATILTKAKVLEMLIEDRTLAREEGQSAAAIKADELLGREFGLFTEKKNIVVRRISDLSEDELKGLLSEFDGGTEDEAPAGPLN